MIPRSEIDAVKERADIGEIISSYGITLKGSSTLKGLCPFHDERSPSFSVRPAFGTYRCFGCGASGDVFSFIQEKDGFSFTDAVKMVAERYGIEVNDSADKEDEQDRVNKKRLYDLMQETARFFANKYRMLPQDHPARLELRNRNLEEVEGAPNWLKDFGIGYAPEGWSTTTDYLVSKGYRHEEILTAGVAGKSESGRTYDLFRGRLTWEIRDIQGRVIGFGARKLFDSDNGPKYLNSPQTPLYDKSKVLYGLDLARKEAYVSKTLIVVEGYTDVMAFAAVGIDNAVAPCGTAFGDQHANISLRLLGENGRLVFGFDGDAAGQAAANKAFQITAPIHNRAYVTQTAKGDPCDIRLEEGDLALIDLVAENNLVPLTEFVLRHELSNHDVNTAEGRSNFLRAAAPMLGHITDYAIREDYISKVTFWSGATMDVVRRTMKISNANTSRSEPPPPYPFDDTLEPSEQERSLLRGKQESLIALLIQYPKEFLPLMGRAPETEQFADENLSKLYSEVWYLVKQRRGDLGKISPDEFSNPDTMRGLMHKEFPEVEVATDGSERVRVVVRVGKSLFRALSSLQSSHQAQTLRTRIGQAYGQEGSSTDTSALAEIVARNQEIKQRRRRR